MRIATTSIGDWIPRAIPDLRVYTRGDRRLCLNPDVPAWLVTTEAALLLLQLADGRRSVDDIVALLEHEQIPVRPEHVRQFFDEARATRLFDVPAEDHEDVQPWRDRRLSAMHLHLTDRCNLQCTYCFRNSHPHVPIRHEPARFVAMLEYIKPFCTPEMLITFTGGEPLAYPGFQEVVEAATRLGYRNLLLTNAILMTEARAQFVGKHFETVQISLDGPDRESHAATRGDNFDKVVAGIRRVARTGAGVTVQVTVTRSNLGSVRNIKRLMPDNVKLTYTPMMPMGRGSEEGDEFISDDEFLDVSRGVAEDLGEKPGGLFFSGARNRSCHAGLSNLSIADTGDVYPCHLFHSQQYHLGNIFHDDFDRIFFGEPLRAYVESMDVIHNNSVCAGCEVRFLCGGGCKANTLHSSGDHRGVDLYCSYLKRSIVDNLFDSLGVSRPPEDAALSLPPEDSADRVEMSSCRISLPLL